jgi:hypothetical protein
MATRSSHHRMSPQPGRRRRDRGAY